MREPRSGPVWWLLPSPTPETGLRWPPACIAVSRTRTSPSRAGDVGGSCSAGPTGSTIVVPLPARMTEPIQPPSKPPTDDRPLSGQLGSKSVAVTPAPAARTASENSPLPFRDPPADEFITHDGIPPGGTVPAQPGLPGHPMNDVVLQSPPQTAPATDPADSAGPLSRARPANQSSSFSAVSGSTPSIRSTRAATRSAGSPTSPWTSTS